MRHIWVALAFIVVSAPAHAVKPLWCVQNYEAAGVYSLGYSFDNDEGGLACDNYMRPIFEIKQTAPNTCLFDWWLNILGEVIPDTSFEANHMVSSTLKKSGQSDWHHKYCYQGVDDSFHTFLSCNNPEYLVYSNWKMLEDDVLGFKSISFYGDGIGDGLVFSYENFYQAFMLFKEKTGCPAMF